MTRQEQTEETKKLRRITRAALARLGATRQVVEPWGEYFYLPQSKEDEFFELRDKLPFRCLYSAPNRFAGLQVRWDLPNEDYNEPSTTPTIRSSPSHIGLLDPTPRSRCLR